MVAEPCGLEKIVILRDLRNQGAFHLIRRENINDIGKRKGISSVLIDLSGHISTLMDLSMIYLDGGVQILGEDEQEAIWSMIRARFSENRLERSVFIPLSRINIVDYVGRAYMKGDLDNHRYILGIRDAKNPLVVIGCNPSRANELKPDPTIQKVIYFVERNGYDGFIMLNLYPQRSIRPGDIHARVMEKWHEENLLQIKYALEGLKNPDVVAAWGDNILRRDFLCASLQDIAQAIQPLQPRWHSFGPLTKKGNPTHPLRISFSTSLIPFDIDEYINHLG